MSIEYILLDVDDTIISTDRENHREYEEGRRQFAYLIGLANQGKLPPIGFCTGREASYVLGMTRWLAIPNSWSVVESGLILYNPSTQERLYHPKFTPKLQQVFEEIRKTRIPQLLKEFPFLFPYVGKEWNVALERKEGAPPIEECERVIKEMLRELPGIAIHASSIAVDISPEGIDKGSGILFLAEKTGIDPRSMLLIDDSLGGKPAADKVGFLACPANASKNFQELVAARGEQGYLSPCNLVEGVVDAICHFTGVSLTA